MRATVRALKSNWKVAQAPHSALKGRGGPRETQHLGKQLGSGATAAGTPTLCCLPDRPVVSGPDTTDKTQQSAGSDPMTPDHEVGRFQSRRGARICSVKTGIVHAGW